MADPSSRSFLVDSVRKTTRTLVFVLALPLILAVAVVAVIPQLPISLIKRSRMRRREKRFAADMKSAGRFISWAEARSEVDSGRGAFIGEFALRGGYRLWWTLEDVRKVSPHPCYFDDEGPPGLAHAPFFDWCCSRFTDPESGRALLVDLEGDQSLDYFMRGAAGRHVLVDQGFLGRSGHDQHKILPEQSV